ncbi:hypothetical protein JTB14_027117 [Gonioctena quinquepunctata]|nr:hypothetical protein JTB14_027117 [Gonioctena quinquepunctata]
MLDGEATEEQLMAEMEQCEAYLRRFTGLRLQVEQFLLKPVDEQSVDDDTGRVDPREASEGFGLTNSAVTTKTSEKRLSGYSAPGKMTAAGLLDYEGNVAKCVFAREYTKVTSVSKRKE